MPTVAFLNLLLGEDSAIISDALNHASIIDGVRLSKAKRFRYNHNDMADLEAKLQEAQDLKHRIIVTDGSFSMDGTIAQLDKICDLADKYQALVMVDESHSSGFIGKTGRGTHEYRNVMGRIDIITGTLGKALGGAMGGFTSGRKEIIEMLRQRSRPYLFSNSLGSGHCGRFYCGTGYAFRNHRTTRQTGMEYEIFPRAHDGRRFPDYSPANTPLCPLCFTKPNYPRILRLNYWRKAFMLLGFITR